jgi:DNA topoisomerase-3
MTAHWEHQLQGMAERNQAYQPFMQSLLDRINGLMGQVKSGPVPESLRHLPKVERPAFKRKRKPAAKGSTSKRTSNKKASS